VVWLELVWLFSDAVAALEPVEPAAGATDLPPAVAARRPVVLVGVRVRGGREGYYGLGFPAAAGPPVAAGFVAVDADGEPRPGVWTYGRAPGLTEYGAPRPPPIGLPPTLAALRSAYAGTLR